MSNLKRFLAMTLVMVMMIGALAMSTSAKLFDDVEALKDADLSAAIDLLSELGIAKGTTTETFDPESPVTRQQFALFVARIHTATPEYFVSNETVKNEIPFGDLKDPTYYLAIKHCYENNIVNGKVAPTEEALGTFDPEGEIMLQEAVTMLVRALGYDNQGLSYPVGFLAKAKEIGLLEGFGLAALKADAIVSRGDMAALLYNYFQGNYYEVNLVWNTSSAKYVEMVSLKPVAEKFGITKIEGYVTAIEGASLPMWVEDTYVSSILGAGGAVTDMNWVKIGINDPISVRNAANLGNGGFDIIISWVTPDVEVVTKNEWITTEVLVGGVKQEIAQSVSVSTNNRVVGHLRSNKAALGLDVDYKDLEGSRYLLGLKVVAYLDSANRGIKLPAPIVEGTKTRAKTSTVDGDVLEKDGRFVMDGLSFTDADGAKSTFVQYNLRAYDGIAYLNDNLTGNIGQARRDEGDINYYTGYVFTTDTGRTMSARGLAENMYSRSVDQLNLVRLAQIIATKNADVGAMDIDVIDNGVNRDGSPNRYVIFTPYEARYIRDRDAGNIRTYRGNGSEVGVKENAVKLIDAAKYTSSALTNGKAYFINDQGEYILVKQELVEITENNTLGFVTGTTADTATFSVGVASAANPGSYGNVIVNFNDNNVKYRTLYNRSNIASVAYTRSGTGNPNAYAIDQYDGFKLFTIASAAYNYGFVGQNTGTFLIYRDKDVDNKADRRYGYVMSEGGSQTYVNGQSAVMYQVHNIKTGAPEIIYDVTPLTVVPYKAGAHISYRTVGFNSPNTHQIIAVVSPFGDRFQVLGNFTNTQGTYDVNADNYRGSILAIDINPFNGATPAADDLDPTQTKAKSNDDVYADVNKAVAAFRKAMNAAANQVDGAITAGDWNGIMKALSVSGATFANNGSYDAAIDKILDAAGTVGILADMGVELIGSATDMTTVAGNYAFSIISGTAAGVIPATITNAIKALSGNIETLNANEHTKSQALKLQAVVDAINALIAELDANSKAKHPALITADPTLVKIAKIIEDANSTSAPDFIAITPTNTTVQQTKDAILEAYAKVICEGLYDSTLATAAARNATRFNLVGIVGDVATIRNETNTKEYKLSFANYTGTIRYTLSWTGTSDIGLSETKGRLYVQERTYDAATLTWSAFANVGTGRIDFSGINVKFTNDPNGYRPMNGRLVNLGEIANAQGFLFNDAGTIQNRTAYGLADMTYGINDGTDGRYTGYMYQFNQTNNGLTIGDNYQTVANRQSTTLTNTTLICIYDVNYPMTRVNSIRLADFRTLMLAIHNNRNPILGAIRSAMFVQNSAKHAEVVYVGLDSHVLSGTQLDAYNTAINLKYNPIPVPSDNDSNSIGTGYYTVMSRDTNTFFQSGGTYYSPITIKDLATGLEAVGKYAVAYNDTSVQIGDTVYITSTTVNDAAGVAHRVVAMSTPRAVDLTTANINTIIAAGTETKLDGSAYYYDAVSGYAYARTQDGIAHYSYGNYISYIEVKANTLGTYTKVAQYESGAAWGKFNRSLVDVGTDKRTTRVQPNTTTNPIYELTYDLIDVRHISSNGVVKTIASNDWTAGTVTTTGTIYIVPHTEAGSFTIINVLP